MTPAETHFPVFIGKLRKGELATAHALGGAKVLNPKEDKQTDPSFKAEREQSVLWALQQYQKVIRHWIHDLTAIEFTVLMQILDRTVGWQKTRYRITLSNLLQGGPHYDGVENAVKRASLMKALRSLEAKGMISREARPYDVSKDYVINLDWAPIENEGRK